MRNPLACISCRSAKQKCIHNDAPPCDRCKANGRAEQCEFPQPGTSAIHRRPKRPRPSEDVGTASPQQAASSVTATPPHRDETQHVTPGIGGGSEAAGTPPSASSVLFRLDPIDLLVDEVKNSYLRCAYKWSFHHIPTLLLRIRDRTLERWLAWAMLALAIRFVKSPPAPFKTQTEASNAYAAHARQMLQADLETPSISRVQALLMLTGHDWGAGNGRRAWIYLGMAIRLVEVMDLTQEPNVLRNRAPTREEFIEAEVRRRTAWTCFLMDSLLSGGKGRKRSMNASDMAIQLPCERENFVFGEPVYTEHLDGKVRLPPVELPKGEIGIIGYSLRVANIWGKVARWSCSERVKTELPWEPTSQFHHLIHELEEWKSSLPPRTRYQLFALHSHNALEQGQAFCYMHSICFMSYMFLHRAYLPVLGPHQNGSGGDDGPNSYNEHREKWRSWQKMLRRELFNESTTVLEMLEEMRTFGVYFLRGLVPWIGFTIYTAVGVMLYSVYFPSGEDDPQITAKARERVLQGCLFLKEMKTQWPMAETWFETIKRMQAYYRSTRSEDSFEERTALRRAMTDYGALQPTPVQKHTDSVRGPDTTIVQTTISPVQGHRPMHTPQPNIIPLPQHQQQHPNHPTDIAAASQYNSLSPATTAQTPQAYTASFSWSTATSIPIPEMDQTFDFPGFDMSNAEMDELMMAATQDFWASFPGEVGTGYDGEAVVS